MMQPWRTNVGSTMITHCAERAWLKPPRGPNDQAYGSGLTGAFGRGEVEGAGSANGSPPWQSTRRHMLARDGRRPIALKEDFSGMIRWEGPFLVYVNSTKVRPK